MENSIDSSIIVIEFKIVRSGETLETAAQNAINQINEKKYVQELLCRQLPHVIAYSIAFKGKMLCIKSQELT